MGHSIIQQILSNFDVAYMLAINILTYIIIKTHEYFNGAIKIATWIKRLYLVISIIIVTCLYVLFDNVPNKILINSAIAAPVFWSWVLKPIISRTKFDYRSIDKTLN